MYTYTMYSIFSAYRAHAMHIHFAVMLSLFVDNKVVEAALNPFPGAAEYIRLAIVRYFQNT